MHSKSDKREYGRLPMDFILELSAEDTEGGKFRDRAVLEDVSGEGARVMTQQAGKYFPGQLVEMTIYLPGTNEVKAQMTGQATVVRVDLLNNSGHDERSGRAYIAVKINDPLRFERD